jgi:hypothetical protein
VHGEVLSTFLRTPNSLGALHLEVDAAAHVRSVTRRPRAARQVLPSGAHGSSCGVRAVVCSVSRRPWPRDEISTRKQGKEFGGAFRCAAWIPSFEQISSCGEDPKGKTRNEAARDITLSSRQERRRISFCAFPFGSSSEARKPPYGRDRRRESEGTLKMLPWFRVKILLGLRPEPVRSSETEPHPRSRSVLISERRARRHAPWRYRPTGPARSHARASGYK